VLHLNGDGVVTNFHNGDKGDLQPARKRSLANTMPHTAAAGLPAGDLIVLGRSFIQECFS